MASLAKAARKIKRTGKSAAQFKFTSTFEYIELSCNGFWRPDKLKVIWLRNHRRVESISIPWILSEDRGPNGAEGKATFNPTIAVSLIVTLYRAPKKTTFEEKVYKFYIESDGPGGKKILASFNCDMAEYAAAPSSSEALDMTFKCVSKKVNKAVLGITVGSQFLKEGNSLDDDMQSTFSAVSMGQESMLDFDDEDDEDESGEGRHGHSGALVNGANHLSPVKEESGTQDPVVASAHKDSLVVLGNGDELKRDAVPVAPPSKPPRTASFKGHNTINREKSKNHENPPNDQQRSEKSESHNGASTTTTAASEEATTSIAAEKESLPSGGVNVGDIPVIKLSDSLGSRSLHTGSIEVSSKSSGSVENSLPVVHESEATAGASTAIPNGHVPSSAVDESVAKEHSDDRARSGEHQAESRGREAQNQDEGQGHNATTQMHNEKPSDRDTKVQNQTTEAQVHNDVHDREGTYTQDVAPTQSEMKSVKEESESTKPITASAITTTTISTATAATVMMENSTEKTTTNQINESHSNSTTPKESESESKPNGSATSIVKDQQQPTRKSSFGTNKSFRAEDSLFETALLLAEADSVREKPAQPAAKVTEGRPRRKTVDSKDVYKAPPNPYLEQEEPEPPSPPVSPTQEWLGDVPIIDCFDEAQSRKKLDGADLIGLYFSASWCPPCRRFLPKLIYFYHQLKQHNKSFEVIYLSSDNSKHDMMKYMVEQQMPWAAVEYGSQIAETLKAKFNVKAIPLLTVVSTKGDKIEESAKKAVEGANTASAAVKLYNKWQKLLAPEGEGESGLDATNMVADGSEGKEKKGLLHKVKNHIRGKNKTDKGGEISEGDSGDVLSDKSVEGSSEQEKHPEEKVRTKSKGSRSKSSNQEQLEEKDERIRHLEAVNITLKQTNDDLNEEVAELRRQLDEQTEKVRSLESTYQRLEDEKRTLNAHMNIRGWLFKRGVKGPTANVWRRRYFRCDQGSRICYYKTSAESTPQGFIDLDKVISVQEVSAAQQDKNHATFLVQCDGRTFQLQGHDETTMRKWMNAIEYLKNYRQTGGGATSVLS